MMHESGICHQVLSALPVTNYQSVPHLNPLPPGSGDTTREFILKSKWCRTFLRDFARVASAYGQDCASASSATEGNMGGKADVELASRPTV